MTEPYYSDPWVSLYLGDCLEIDAWLAADVLVTDPPYGIAWQRGEDRGRVAAAGIQNDHDTTARDSVLTSWGTDRPGVVFGSLHADFPQYVHLAVWEKPQNAGVIGSTIGMRRDLEAVFFVGEWPRRKAFRGSVLRSTSTSSGNPHSIQGRYGHPHAKPLDLMEDLVRFSPPGVIADPFAGSGSTLVAAKIAGRKVIGVELDEKHCETAARRLAQDVLDFGGCS